MTAPEPTVAAQWREDAQNGKWKPAPTDPLHECEFIRTGFRSWGLASPTGQEPWRLTLSRLDFGDSNPSAILEVHAEGHDMAFGDLGWFVFSHAIGVNGGTNFNGAVRRLSKTLGGSEEDWARRVTYLISRARQANVSGGNGTYASAFRPELGDPPDYIFDLRIREGRTMSLFGPGSAGKTTIADGLIASLCSGTEIIPGWHPVRARRTMILDWDEGYEEEAVRLGAMCVAYDIELTAGYHYKRMTRPLHDVADEIGAYIAQNKIEVLVISPMGRASRNFGENITAPVDEVHEILRNFGTTNILIDHVTGDNIKGGAQREFGSVRKRDNVRGSYAVDVQSEEPGVRVLVMRNTKADALSPRQPDQAIRVEFEPHWPKEDGSYDTIRFREGTIGGPGYASPQQSQFVSAASIRVTMMEALEDGPLTVDQLMAQTGFNAPSIRTKLNLFKGTHFNRLDDGRWELT